MKKTQLITFSSLLALLLATACTEEKKNDSKVTLANPASVNCTEKGGTLKLMTKPTGGQYGVCYFEDNMQCEEWALMRGRCPVGGVKVTGYSNPEAVYCAITGGQPQDNETKCKTAEGKVCEARAFYTGSC